MKEHLDVDHNDSTVNMAQMDAATRTKQAQETLKKVMHKQNHQREKRDFNPQVHQQQPEERREARLPLRATGFLERCWLSTPYSVATQVAQVATCLTLLCCC